MFFIGKAGGIMLYDRGDPVGWDFSLPAIVTDGDAHDMDLSGIIPAGTVAVLLNVYVQDNTDMSAISFRKKGNSNWVNISSPICQVTMVFNCQDIIVFCDSNGVIEYKTANTTFSFIDVVVKGWFI